MSAGFSAASRIQLGRYFGSALIGAGGGPDSEATGLVDDGALAGLLAGAAAGGAEPQAASTAVAPTAVKRTRSGRPASCAGVSLVKCRRSTRSGGEVVARRYSVPEPGSSAARVPRPAREGSRCCQHANRSGPHGPGAPGYPSGEPPFPGDGQEDPMLALLGLLLVIWLVCIVLGVVIKGLFWLIVVGAVLFVATALVGFVKREALGRGR
ncbi:hypothetical protein ACFPN7_11230 [Amycolatopsis halotolerans]